MSQTQPAAVIVLAAGAGTRMRSEKPKVLHQISGRSLVHHAIATAQSSAARRIVVVVKHARDEVVAHIQDFAPDVLFADQDDIPGTGRAAQCALSVLDASVQAESAARLAEGGQDGRASAVASAQVDGPIIVTSGDVPLLDAGTLRSLVEAHIASESAITVLTTRLGDPTGYGRIVRDASNGQVLAIVEDKDATTEQREIGEINGGIYVFTASTLRDTLARVGRDNSQGEMYLTDVIGLAVADGLAVRAVLTEDPWLLEGVNDRLQLATLQAELNRRIVAQAMIDGVTVVDPATTWIDVDVDLAPDVTLLPNVQLHGVTSVGAGTTIGPDTTLTDMEIGQHATIVRTHGSLSVIGDDTLVGPFAYLRPGTKLGLGAKIGAFVETKNSEIGAHSKVPHLSYVGDATIGEGTNIGAATVFANYDGVQKHRTTIGSYVRTGSDNIFVAPITIGDGAYTGAGTTVRYDVPPGSLALSGGTQRLIEEWVIRQRPGTDAAEAAEAALAQDPNYSHGLSDQARAEQARDERTRD